MESQGLTDTAKGSREENVVHGTPMTDGYFNSICVIVFAFYFNRYYYRCSNLKKQFCQEIFEHTVVFGYLDN